MIERRDMDVAFQLFAYGMVGDGNLISKCGRDRLVWSGYAIRHDGMQALTGKGAAALILNWRAWLFAWKEWRVRRRNCFVASQRTEEGKEGVRQE